MKERERHMGHFLANTREQALLREERAEYTEGPQCGAVAPEGVEDFWGDSCAGTKCWLQSGHELPHAGPDGINGIVTWNDQPQEPR